MISLIIFLVVAMVYMVPGLYLARSLYSERVKAIRTGPGPAPKLPTKPKRPEIKLSEMLHATAPRKCAALVHGATTACSCKYRDDWVKLKNAWIDYNEWKAKYGDLERRYEMNKDNNDSVHMVPILLTVPFWPITASVRFIQGGAKNIPDYREIERMEDMLEIK